MIFLILSLAFAGDWQPTCEMRFVKADVKDPFLIAGEVPKIPATGLGPYKLQQKFLNTKKVYKINEALVYEWRDLPLVEVKK